MLIGGGHYLLSTYYGLNGFPVYMIQVVSHLMPAAAPVQVHKLLSLLARDEGTGGSERLAA